MSAISPLRVFKALFRSFIDISTPLMKYFVNKCSCLSEQAIPRMLRF